ncbi:MAG: PepSY-associated TM helix domain-containing protein [Acidovorax sp.]
MARTQSLHRWFIIHKWASLICTTFLFIICLTGLPLVFSEEINDWLTSSTRYANVDSDIQRPNLDHLAAIGREMYPNQIITSFFVDDAEPQVYLWMAPSREAIKANRKAEHFIRFDARTAQVLEESQPPEQRHRSFVGLVLSLHRDLFAGLLGELFLGLMALLFVIAIVSGAVLYGPFMRKLDFGTVRAERSTRLKWLDLHNLLGIVTLAWAFVVGATGILNELSTPLFAIWQRTDVQAVLTPWRGKPAPAQTELGSVQAALDTARRAVPATTFTGITYPGDEGGSPYHYLLWGHGSTSLTSRLFTPVLVDARTGALTAVVRMPWYLRALEVSRPLHFGDYGGLPLKVLWALLDIITLIVLGSGLYLWIARRETHAHRIQRMAAAPQATPTAKTAPPRH